MKKKNRMILSAILFLIAAACVAYIVYYFASQSGRGKVYEDVQKQVESELGKDSEKQEQSEETNPIDFEKLQEINADIYAWISIPETNINYPIVQSATDNEYYLNTTIEGQAGLPGSIYTENFNSKDFTDFNTLIYGHDMLDGTMFQNLHNYGDPEYLEKHPKVYIYTPQKKLTYEIYEAVVYDDRHILQSFDFTQESHRQAYIDSIKSIRELGSNFNNDVAVDVNSKIITMSTCIGDKPDNRFLVGAVLTEEYVYTQ